MRVVYQNQYDLFFGAAADWLQTLSVRVSYLLKSRCKNSLGTSIHFFCGGNGIRHTFFRLLLPPPKKQHISLRPSLMLPQHQTPPQKKPANQTRPYPHGRRRREHLDVPDFPRAWSFNRSPNLGGWDPIPVFRHEKRPPGWARVFVGNYYTAPIFYGDLNKPF